jgi:hypothetical protein
MSEEVDRTPHHEEAETQAVGLCGVQSLKCAKYLRQFVGRNSDA